MPPKCKFTKDEIIQAALDIARSEGISSITARALGGKLGSSSKPIFSVLQNMEEVQQEVISAAKDEYNKYVQEGLSQTQSFKGAGTQYILFAFKEPKLFQLLFMTEPKSIPDLSNILSIIDKNYEQILLSIEKEYKIDSTSAQNLYQHLWIYTHGIATLCATKMCRFTKKEINEMITEVCLCLLRKMEAGEKND